MRYTVVLLRDEETGAYTALVPALPGCITQGDTVDAAIAQAVDAATVYLEDLAAHDEEVPVEATGPVVATIDVPVPVTAHATA
jgi:predicted RNase H-like HicB family nuclease